jgi:hypothetical protein
MVRIIQAAVRDHRPGHLRELKWRKSMRRMETLDKSVFS